MSLWESNSITNIDIGITPNDGTGDNIRDAFNKVDTNFANISSFLRSTSTIDFTEVNIQNYLGAESANIVNMFVANATGNNASILANVQAGNLIANTGIYSNGPTHITGNLYLTGNIIPAGSGQYDLGSAANPFRAIYYNTAITPGVVQTSDAGQIVVHANAIVGDTKDVGILGNISHHYTSNTYAFFGYQYQTNNFVYKITNTNPTLGNAVIYDGIYGNAQLGSLFLSNSTVSSSTSTGGLIVAGGAGIAGNLNLGANATIAANVVVGGNITTAGNIYSNNAVVLTSSSIGYYGSALTGGIVLGSARYTSSEQSTSYNTGAVAIPNGGLGVAGNVVAGAFYGNIYGNVLTANQPYITSLGQLTGLNVNGTTSTTSLQASTIGTTNMTVIGTIDLTSATINGATFSSFPATGNISAGTVYGGFVGNVYGNVLTSVQPYITTLSNISLTNLTSSGILTSTGAVNLNGVTYVQNLSSGNAVINGGYIHNLANITATSGIITTGVVTNFSTANAVISGGYISGLSNAYVTTGLVTNFSTANAVITGGYINSVANVYATTGVITNFSTANAVISGGYINTANITTPIGNITTVNATTVNATTVGNSSTAINGNASLSGLVVNNTTAANVSITATANVVLAASTSNGSGIFVTGNILPRANISYNVGSSTSWFNTFYGKSTQAQYADLAEKYASDADYDPGTVVVFGGDAEITVTTVYADARVAGAISTDPAYLMNASESGLPVALRGRIPVKVIGPVRKGDSLVTAAKQGYATSVGTSTQFGQAVFAKSIETDLDPGEKVITAVIL